VGAAADEGQREQSQPGASLTHGNVPGAGEFVAKSADDSDRGTARQGNCIHRQLPESTSLPYVIANYLSGETPMFPEIFNLSCKTALVTGGSKGLGKAMARGMVEAGADVVISSRHEEELRPALDEILRGTGRKGSFIVADMARRDEARRLAKTALERM